MSSVGVNSTVTIENTSEEIRQKLQIQCGDNATLHIRGIKACNSSVFIQLGDGAELTIGSGTMFNGRVGISMLEPSRLTIGDGCLFAQCDIWTSDFHSIVDIGTNQRINFAEDISIGNRVWLGGGALVLKGAKIADDCVVAARAVVTKSTPCEANTVIGGNPATIVKRGVRWDRDRGRRRACGPAPSRCRHPRYAAPPEAPPGGAYLGTS